MVVKRHNRLLFSVRRLDKSGPSAMLLPQTERPPHPQKGSIHGQAHPLPQQRPPHRHRVVHDGPAHAAYEVVPPELTFYLRQHISFAPLHLPAEILGIDTVTGQYPGLGQGACFDTAFHPSIPEIARRLPMVRTLGHEGVCRYAFHGLSYEYIAG